MDYGRIPGTMISNSRGRGSRKLECLRARPDVATARRGEIRARVGLLGEGRGELEEHTIQNRRCRAEDGDSSPLSGAGDNDPEAVDDNGVADADADVDVSGAVFIMCHGAMGNCMLL